MNEFQDPEMTSDESPRHNEVPASATAYEKTDVDVRGVLLLFGSTGIGILVALFGVWQLLVYFHADAARHAPPQSPLSNAHSTPPSPRIQVHSLQDYRNFMLSQTSHLETYGWTDRRQGKVHIPISSAIDLMLKRPQPVPKGK